MVTIKFYCKLFFFQSTSKCQMILYNVAQLQGDSLKIDADQLRNDTRMTGGWKRLPKGRQVKFSSINFLKQGGSRTITSVLSIFKLITSIPPYVLTPCSYILNCSLPWHKYLTHVRNVSYFLCNSDTILILKGKCKKPKNNRSLLLGSLQAQT